MMRPLVTTVDGSPGGVVPKPVGPTLLILFNDKAGPQQVVDIVASKHAFVESQTYDTIDEQQRPAWLLVLTCETATAAEHFDMIGSRLPDYIQARRFPASRLPEIRRAAQP
jgi:hypothetical protein